MTKNWQKCNAGKKIYQSSKLSLGLHKDVQSTREAVKREYLALQNMKLRFCPPGSGLDSESGSLVLELPVVGTSSGWVVACLRLSVSSDIRLLGLLLRDIF
jgi:hypothetical protein